MIERENAWTIHHVGVDSWPLVIHVPHSSAFIPDQVREHLLLDDHELSDELRRMTDHYTDRLAFDALAAWGLSAQVFVNNVSRLVVDPERLPDDQEPMARIGMGAVYRVTSNLQPLREPDPKEEQRLLDEWFHPYSSAFAGLVDDTLAEHGRCLIMDLHSYPSVPLHYELDPSARRPGVCVGADRFHTPMRLIDSAEFAFESAPHGVALDTPFAGTYVPLAHLGRTKAVHSVMIEIRRDLYQDEPGGPRHQGYDDVVTYLSRFLASAVSVIGISM